MYYYYCYRYCRRYYFHGTIIRIGHARFPRCYYPDNLSHSNDIQRRSWYAYAIRDARGRVGGSPRERIGTAAVHKNADVIKRTRIRGTLESPRVFRELRLPVFTIAHPPPPTASHHVHGVSHSTETSRRVTRYYNAVVASPPIHITQRPKNRIPGKFIGTILRPPPPAARLAFTFFFFFSFKRRPRFTAAAVHYTVRTVHPRGYYYV